MNYSIADKYLLTASFRADGSSVFGANNKWGYFPSLSVAWRASEEKFIRNLNIFHDQKFRASWGTTGNQGIAPYQTFGVVRSSSDYNYPYNGTDQTDIGFLITNSANPSLFIMKHVFYIAILAMALFTIASSCNKSLTETPISFVSPDQFYTSPEQVEAAYAASMGQLWNKYGGYSDPFGAVFVNDDQSYGGDLVISSNFGDEAWRIHYVALRNINAALEAIQKGSLTGTSQEVIDELVGQGKFLRSFNYFMLVRMFGDVPLIKEETPDPSVTAIARSPIADVYALIDADLTEAIAKLPDTWAGKPGRPTKGTAQGMLAKVYLTMATAPLNLTENYAKAAALALQVMQAGIYHLEQDVHDLFQVNNKYGSEMMWSFNSNGQDLSTPPQAHTPGFLNGWGGGAVEPAFEQSFPSQPRKNAYLLFEYNGLPYTDVSWSPDNFPFCQKFINVSSDDFAAFRSTVNLPILRYADVLLIYAEAKNMANGSPTQDAVDAINEVINRANGYVNNPDEPLLTTGLSKQAFDDAVLQERSWELCFENDRWFNLVRKRIVKEKNPLYQQNFTDDDYLFPIPELDLRLDKLLTQNRGYPLPQ
ncbi:MAG: RagB/SusD family nutrient uptake outer membrane protein [Flavitalea sp.]